MLRVNLLAKKIPHELKQVSSLFNLRSANFFYKIWTKFRGDLGVNGDKNPLRRRQVVNMLRVNLLAKKIPHELKQVSSLFNLRSANFFYKISLTDSVSYLISGTFYYSTCTKVILSFLKLIYVVPFAKTYSNNIPTIFATLLQQENLEKAPLLGQWTTKIQLLQNNLHWKIQVKIALPLMIARLKMTTLKIQSRILRIQYHHCRHKIWL